MSTAQTPQQQAPLWNIANILTMVRFAMVPVFIIVGVLYHETVGGRLVIAGVFALAMLTDFADGKLARKYNLITDFGKIADSLADKGMTGAAFILLSIWEYIPWWMTILILLREFGITIMRFTILKHGALPANFSGKAKTMLQSIAIAWCLLPFDLWWEPWGRWIGVALVTLALILTVYSGILTLRDGLRLRNEALARRDA